MRIWDIQPKYLCQQHLLGEHRELHALWSILNESKPAFKNHPETRRWPGKLKALYGRHQVLVKEMKKRGYKHNSPLDKKLAKGQASQNFYLQSIRKQKAILKKKPCGCFAYVDK